MILLHVKHNQLLECLIGRTDSSQRRFEVCCYCTSTHETTYSSPGIARRSPGQRKAYTNHALRRYLSSHSAQSTTQDMRFPIYTNTNPYLIIEDVQGYHPGSPGRGYQRIVVMCS